MTTNLLFHRRTLGKAIESYSFPDDLLTLQARILQWLEPLRSGVLDEVKEVSLHGQFLGDIFGRVLGYRSIVDGGGKSWEIHAEQSIADGGGTADAAIGLFTAVSGKSGTQKLAGKIIAPIELKGAKNDLDRPAPGRKESAVDQGWRYANYTPDCKWVIVSNYREIRLYNLSKTPAYYEQFYLSDLADVDQFKQFYFLLCRDNFIPAVAGSVIDALLSASNQAEEEITDRLYREYKHVRLELTQHFTNYDAKIGVEIAIEKAQKTLDRILFITFCEDRGLLPARTIEQAHDRRDPYHPERQIWDNYQSVFRSVDKGNDALKIPSYNGGLFKPDPILDKQLKVSDRLCTQLKNLTRFDFETEVSVNILGHIFEQSITDLEELRATAAGEKFDISKGKRKTQGVYYTPAYITQYIVDVALGGYLRRQEAALRIEYSLTSAPLSERVTKKRQQIEVKFWEAYRAIIVKTRVIDPACGSGAFLIAAFEYLSREYERVNTALAELKLGQRSVFDLNKTILNNNLYGVDLSPESVEITKLSLWLKTAERGKPLTDLNANIKAGNSIVHDPNIDARAFNWEAAFPDIFAAGGFDVVIGNPPYVRSNVLPDRVKIYLQDNYATAHGSADLYVYFYEQGLNLLKPGGNLAYIVNNKWLKSSYGEKLRQFFTEKTIFEQIVDFGHAPIFQDADTFPCIASIRKRSNLDDTNDLSSPVLICSVPREKLVDINLTQYVQQEGFNTPWHSFTSQPWILENSSVDELIEKIKHISIPLKEFAGSKPYWGILTGANEVFIIDEDTKNKLVSEDQKSIEIIKPFWRGQDVKRWNSGWNNTWMIFTRRGIDLDKYPAIKNYLNKYRSRIEPRPKEVEKSTWQGRKNGSYKWYEIQDAVDYYELFSRPKIIYKEIQFHPEYSYDDSGYLANNKVFIIPSSDLYLLAVLNSPLMWWYNWRYLPHMKDDALSPSGYLMETLPIAPPDDKLRVEVESIASRSIELTKANQSSYRDIYDWLQLEHQIEKIGRKLEDFSSLSLDEFVQEIKKRKPKDNQTLTPQSLKEIKAAYQEYAPQIQTRKAEILQLEHQLSDLVNRAYQLTPTEIELMWRTAPPRMPITRKD